MRYWLAAFVILSVLAGTGLFVGYNRAKKYPYQVYSRWMQGKDWNRHYRVSNYRPLLLVPSASDEIRPYKEDYGQLWKPFPLRNSLVPLPTRHPLFVTVPLIELKSKSSTPLTGMIIAGPTKREIIRIYTLPTSLSQDHTQGQEIFKLPFVRTRILKMDPDRMWKEVFTHEIVIRPKGIDEMIHDLYVLHLRSRILPAETLKYGLLKDGKALIELASKDRDYRVELILNQQNGKIYSYALRTSQRDVESQKLRSKFLEGIAFQPVDPDMGRILYTEFKQLSFARQVDQEGLLYLFSAWTQDIEKLEILKDMIFYLERGKDTLEQLTALYRYAYKKYGKTFTTRNVLTGISDQNLTLQRKIELEDLEKKYQAENVKPVVPVAPELTAEEKMNEQLKKAKESGPAETGDMTIH